MVNLDYSSTGLAAEIERILNFIDYQVGTSGKIVVGLSGGIDSDVTARLCARVVSPDQMKCFTILQDDFEQKYINNAHQLAKDIGCKLIEIPLAPFPRQLITLMADADPSIDFRPNGILDVARSKCALRTFVFSAYSERGFLVVGPSNKTEIELGYYLPFGDGLSHFSPIAHLYKTQVQQLARTLGTRQSVIDQQPAAGFWEGDSDLEGIAYWLYNQAPIQVELDLDDAQEKIIHDIHRQLSFRAIDISLTMLNDEYDIDRIVTASGLSTDIVKRLINLRERSKLIKNRKLSVRIV